MCILYILTGGLMFSTAGCYTMVHHPDEVIVPHEVVYTSHLPQNVDVHYVPRVRHRYYNIRRNYRRGGIVRHSHVRRHYHNRVRYHNNVRPIRRHQPRLRKRTVRRHYDNRGNLRRRVVTRRYR